jgi:hypothetical protein
LLCKVCQTSRVSRAALWSQTGPAAADHLQALTSYDLRALTFGRSAFVPLEGLNVHVARGGYTGEDGFEVSLNPFSLFRVSRARGSTLATFERLLPSDTTCLDFRSARPHYLPRFGSPPFTCSTRWFGRTRFFATGGGDVSVRQRPGREHNACRGWSFLGHWQRSSRYRGLYGL